MAKKNVNEEIIFYYFIWGNNRWESLLFSIIFLRQIYYKNKIKVVCYTNPPDFFLKQRNNLKFDLEFIKSNFLLSKKFDDESNEIFPIHKNLIYKVSNFFELIEENNSKNIAMDCDVFVLNKFDNFNWEKICVLCENNYVNTGIIGVDSTSINFKIIKNLYKNLILEITQDNFDQINFIEKAMSKDWVEWRINSLNFKKEKIKKNQLLIQEEIIFNHIFKNIFKNIFHNIKIQNNGINLKNDQINNLHLMNYNTEHIYQMMSGIAYSNNIIKKFIKLKKTKKTLHVIKKIENIIYQKKYLFL